jgi:lipid II:glycine glycyltransferase (peptidoglycan interpeptide bridge formation enzyme)
LSEIFQGFHKDSVQRKIRRAEKAGLNYDAGRSERIIEEFYGLLLKTRRRHQLFPQPRVWFKNLFACLGENVQIRVARKEDVPIAAMLTLRHRSSVVYKYGCSDEKFHNLGGMQLLFWRLIEESKTFGAAELDFGRSDMDNEGLVTFKDRFGTKKKLLTYVRYPQAKKEAAAVRWGMRAARQMFSILPDTISPAAGKILYKHIG